MKRNKSNGESKKHKSFEQFKALFADKRSYLRRLAIAAPVWLAVCFTFLFFGPFELVAYSGKSLFYSYKDVGPILAVAAAACGADMARLTSAAVRLAMVLLRWALSIRRRTGSTLGLFTAS